ncbi:hypothetical protein DVH24_007750 [Malus domestica]|uniref:Uncharacterized protein n=1 Tax=Malus domestica TaxID=3750 RepID=A0A498JUB1_MALDO|nr:hypothetical protein DVH24_007750 [Malus domestica]
MESVRPTLKSTILGIVQKYTNLHCILVDEVQHAVEASTLDVDYDVMASKIEVGACYEITEFRTAKIKGQYRVVPHETQVLFTSKTAFQKLASVFPPITCHRFFLQDYNTLYPRLNKVDILTDVICRISALQQVEPKQINQRVVYKCDVTAFNICCFSGIKRSKFYLLFLYRHKRGTNGYVVGRRCRSFFFFVNRRIFFANVLNPADFVIVKNLWKYLLSMQSKETKLKFCRLLKKLQLMNWLFFDPDLHKCLPKLRETDAQGSNHWAAHLSKTSKPNSNTVVMYKVNLILEDETNEMNALIIGKCGEKLFGMSCKDLVLNQRSVEQQQLPKEFLRLIGQKKNFHLRFGNKRNTFNSNDILIHNVTEDTTMHPATPQPLSREIAVSSTTISSSTSTVEPNEQSFKRKRESIRRALFTCGEQSCLTDMDPRELDEIPIKLLKRKSSPTAGKSDTTLPKKSEEVISNCWKIRCYPSKKKLGRYILDTDPRELDEIPIKLLKKKSSPTAGKSDATLPKKS